MKMKAAVIAMSWPVMLMVAGCPPAKGPKPVVSAKLPAEVAGTWKAKDSPWKIVLSQNGTVVSAVIPLGEVDIRPNKTTKVEMKDGSSSTYKAGDCSVEYTAATRELFVSIVMEKIHVAYLDNVLEGNSTDKFVGAVSQDGKEWTAEWMQVFDYGPRFPMDANDMYAGTIVFQKVDN